MGDTNGLDVGLAVGARLGWEIDSGLLLGFQWDFLREIDSGLMLGLQWVFQREKDLGLLLGLQWNVQAIY